ncbi:MAG: protease HtpX, partial [Deltaproteobacteria bacterium]|nr:protease HtpX [Deltaproteobacteria bacterium]
SVLGVRPYMNANGIDYEQLFFFCLVWGFGGAFISLALSRISAKWMMGVKLIDPQRPGDAQWVYNMVEQIAKTAGLPRTPEVGIYESPDSNAFATGPTKNRALVAFSSGILRNMSREEIEGVAAHEVAHIANGDMVTMTLLQGVVNAFVMFFARIIAFAISQSVREESRRMVNFLVVVVLDILFGILGMLVVAWFSRQREFRADAGSAKYVGKSKMIGALKALGRRMPTPADMAQAPSLSAMKISGPAEKPHSLRLLMATHPPLEERIKALESAPY